MNLIFRKATKSDLRHIISLLIEDELGASRDSADEADYPSYEKAFDMISADSNQALMVTEKNGEIIGTCHLTIMPSLTLKGTCRMNIEAVRIADKYRGQKFGEWMLKQALEFAKTHDIKLVQLTTNKQRLKAQKFYERLGFTASHEGMKLKL